MAIGNTKVIQVTNIAPQATKDQMQTLFGYLGKIEDIRLYPTIRDVSCPVQSRICYIKFVDSSAVGISQHMTNTVFIDRALIVIPVQNGEIPDEYYALEMTRNGTVVPGLHVNEPKLPPHVVNSVQGVGSDQVIITTDQQLEANDLPPYPPLPGNYDTAKVEETRRTITVQNIDASTNPKDIIEHFSNAGEVKYLRTATKSSDNSQIYLIEFSDQPSILNALKLKGTQLNGKIIDVLHATQAIVKPQAKSNEAAQKEIEEAMSRFKEAQNMISASIEPVIGMLTKDKRGSRRSRSRSRGRRRRSRSRRRSGSRSRGRRHRSRTRSRDRKRRSRSRKRSRSKTRKSRSKSPSWRRKSRDRSKDKRSRDRSKGRKRSRDRKEREKSKERDRSRTKEKDRAKSKEREKSIERESKSRESKEKKSDKESSVDTTIEKKRSRSRSKYRSRSRDRKKKRRSRSRGSRRRTPSPKHRRRSRSKSKERKKDKSSRKDRKDRDKTRDDRSRSHSKVPRNYDEEEKGFEKADKLDMESRHDKESSEKSDNMDISNSP